jgi:hypothetical protein
MNLRNNWVKVVILIFSLSIYHFLLISQQQDLKEGPGPLSAVHSDSPGLQNCQACHSPELEVSDKKCLDCHLEIASRISAGTGFHKDKGQQCSDCHQEHRENEWKLADFNKENFDHAQTGYILKDAHQRIKDCFLCHREEISFPREKTRSLLLTESLCRSCHISPHPGRQDQCQLCHSQKDRRVDVWTLKGFR